MRTLIQKELREHGILALIALGVGAVLLIPAYQATAARAVSVARGTQWGTYALQPLLSSGLLTSTLLFCGLFGAVLGWLQIRSESHRDLWAWLVHRPISRTSIFASKVAAGMVLYGVGAGLPLVVLVALVRAPGNVAAPFEWEMALPVFANFLGGIACYLGGMLTGLRQVRWYASRGLPLAAAGAVMLGIVGAGEFWQALLITLVGMVALGVATWGAFQGNGYDREQPMWGKVALTGTFLGGSLVVVVLGMAAVMTLLPRPIGQSSGHEMYMMADDGKVYIRVSRGNRDAQMLHPDRSPVLDPDTGRPAEIPLPTAWNRVDAEHRQGYRHSYRQARRFFEPWMIGDNAIWYWTADGRATGYNVMDGRETGRLVPEDPVEGFLRPTDRGPVGVWKEAQTLLTESAVYRVESDAHSQSVLFRAVEGDRIIGAGQLALPEAREALVVVTERRIVMVTARGEIVWDMAYEPEQPDYTQIQIHALATPQEYGVIIAPSYQANQKVGWTLPSHAIWISEGASAMRRVELPALKWPEYQPTFGEVVLAAFLPPPFVAAVTRVYPQEARASMLPLSLGGSVLCAVVGWWLGRRQGLSARSQAGWAGFHLLFGLPGLLASLSMEDWPVRELCPECKQKRPIDEEKCRHCGAGFAPPARNGTEIFEPLGDRGVEASLAEGRSGMH